MRDLQRAITLKIWRHKALVFLFVFFALGHATYAQTQSPIGSGATAQHPSPTLILIHGRGQLVEQKDSIEAEWRAGITSGLSKVGQSELIPESKRRFVWFADLLEPGARGCSFIDGGSADTYKAAGISKWPNLRDFFAKIAEGLNNAQQQATLNALMKDVETYLGNGSAACAVDGRVRDAFGDGTGAQHMPSDAPVVIVAHSLGSMIIYKNLMNRLADTQRPVYLVTIGSMLGARVVQQTLLGSHAAYPAKVPLPVKAWWNVVNLKDPIGFPAERAFSSEFPSKRPHDTVLDLGGYGAEGHSATRYLESEAVGRAIADAWCAASAKEPGCK